MTGQNKFDKTSDPRKKDLKFVLIMLGVYTACCVVFVIGSFFWIREDRKTAQANATATEVAIITQQANATTTAVAHLIEQDGYEYIERFNKSTGNWFVGEYEKQSADATSKSWMEHIYGKSKMPWETHFQQISLWETRSQTLMCMLM